MKKPFILLKTPKDVVKLCLTLALCAAAVFLFFADNTSIAVFSDGGGRTNSLYGLVSNII